MSNKTSPQDPRKVAGNKTTVSPKAGVVSQYASNALTNYKKQAGGRAATPQIDVELARDFDRENQK